MTCALDSEFGKQLRPGLTLLIKAHCCARDVDRSVWDFAVEIKQLQNLGLGPCELRWLLCRGYLQHAIETTVPSQTGRSHLLTDCLQFADRSCFILTDAGVSFAERCDACDSICGLVVGDPQTVAPLKDCDIPCWDTSRRELRFGRELVKRFRVPAPNQQLVLSAFQEEDWPERIDDPLPPVEEIDSKRRLHTTIHSLNRNQKNHLLHFHGDGQGDGVIWEAILSHAD